MHRTKNYHIHAYLYMRLVRCTVIKKLSPFGSLLASLSSSPPLLSLPPPLPPSLPPSPSPSRPPQAGHAGYCMTHTIPILRRNKRQEELLMTSVSWLTPPSNAHHSNQTELQTVSTPPLCPGINTCRPMSYQEDGTKVSNYVTTQTLIHEQSHA